MERVILGIDPGTNIMGYSIIEEIISSKKVNLIYLDDIFFNKKDNHQIRLRNIFNKTLEIIKKYNPDELAIEAQFYGINVQSMLKLGRAQGVCIAACLYRDIPVIEYAPKKIKMSITGNGNASKEQVASMLYKILQSNLILDKGKDATDALAVAYCHYLNSNSNLNLNNQKKYKDWEKFIIDKNL